MTESQTKLKAFIVVKSELTQILQDLTVKPLPSDLDLNILHAQSQAQPKLRLGLEPIGLLIRITHLVSGTLRLRFFVSQCRGNLMRDKVVSKDVVILIEDACERCKQRAGLKRTLSPGLSGLQFDNPHKWGRRKRLLGLHH